VIIFKTIVLSGVHIFTLLLKAKRPPPRQKFNFGRMRQNITFYNNFGLSAVRSGDVIVTMRTTGCRNGTGVCVLKQPYSFVNGEV
jgi:hypothetical protein